MQIFSYRPQADSPLRHLWDIETPPVELFFQGKPEALALLERLPRLGFAVVGTRNPQPRSRGLVRDGIRALPRDFIIVSGLARGIDAEAHHAALAMGLPTIAILGTPLEIEYPPENTELRQRILQAGGLVVSELPPGTEVRPNYFLKRNRLIAAWSHATWIVEAGFRSGALNTAKWARDHHRTCFATPCFPGDPAFAGNQRLLDLDGALPLWSMESLGLAWPDLPSQLALLHSARRRRGRAPRQESLALAPSLIPGDDVEKITYQVMAATTQHGGAAVQDLLDWAIGRGWPPQRFFEALQAALGAGRVLDDRGILVARIQ